MNIKTRYHKKTISKNVLEKTDQVGFMHWVVFPRNDVGVLTPSTLNVTLFGDRAVTEVMRLKWSHYSEP